MRIVLLVCFPETILLFIRRKYNKRYEMVVLLTVLSLKLFYMSFIFGIYACISNKNANLKLTCVLKENQQN